MEDLTEVITSARFRPSDCNTLIYSSSKGAIKLGDLRHSALCDRQAKREPDACSSQLSLSPDTPDPLLSLSRPPPSPARGACQNAVLEEVQDPSTRSFFSEIVSSISDDQFTSDGRYIVSRDYLTLKLWDVNMESRPVQTIHIHEHLRPCLCDLYESDCIFDKFECVRGSARPCPTLNARRARATR